MRLADSNGEPIQNVTGADRLGTAPSKSSLVRVIGYPDGTNQPVSCVNWATHFSATQLQFDCDGYTDGTSGGAFIADASGAEGTGTVVGVMRTLPSKAANLFGFCYVEFFRNMPLLVQLFLWFFVLPELLPASWGLWLKQLPNAPFYTAAIGT